MCYPKRRKTLFERLRTLSTVKFLAGNHESTNNWVKVWLKDNGFSNKNYQITKKGLELRNNLLNEMKQAIV